MEIGEKENAAMSYEYFIRRAFKCGRHAHGANADSFRRLVDTDPERKSKLGTPVELQISEMVGHLNKAIDKFLSDFPITMDERGNLSRMEARLKYVKGAETLKDIVNEGIEITQRFKEF